MSMVKNWLHNGTEWIKALCNSSGHQITESHLHGYNSTDWQKLPLIFGYTDRWVEEKEVLLAPAGDNSLDTAVVPAKYIYIVNSVAAIDVTSAITKISVVLIGNTITIPLKEQAAPAANVWCLWTGTAVLKTGDYCRALFTGTIANNRLILRVWGYKMKIS